MTVAQSQPFSTQRIYLLQQSLTQLDLDNFPKELSSELFPPSFLLWVPKPNQEETKILKKPFKGNAWQTSLNRLPELLKLYNKRSSHPDLPETNQPNDYIIQNPPLGIGFAYTEEHPFVCIDIDSMSEENRRFISSLNSYTEWSPSQEGFHVIIRLESLEAKQELINVFGTGKRNKTDERDLFISNGYVTLTGILATAIPGVKSNTDVRTISLLELQPLLERHFKPRPIPITHRQDQEQGKSNLEVVKKQQDKKKQSPLNKAQVQALLDLCPVKSLSSDIFERLTDPARSALLDMDETEEAREPWLIIGQALHHNFSGGIDGLVLWMTWSQGGAKFNEEALNAAWESFNDTTRSITIGTLIALANAQKPQFPDLDGNGKILGTLGNFHAYLTYTSIQVKTHELTKQVIFDIPDRTREAWRIPAKQVFPPASFVHEALRSDLVRLGASGGTFCTKQIQNFLMPIASETFYNPIREYFETLPKPDGHDYIEELMGTIISQNGLPETPKYRRAYQLFLRKWLLQTVVAACHNAKHHVELSTVLIFVGDQGIGKTRWVSSLFPPELQDYCSSGKDLKMSAYKSDATKLAMELSSTLICNLNEIDKIFSSEANASEFKAFLDMTTDNIVLPYGKEATKMTRRTVFIGSTNKTHLLKDKTGNRRFNLILVKKLLANHGVDINQLWAQVYAMYKEGESWWLSKENEDEREALSLRDKINSSAMLMQDDRFAEGLDETFDINAPYSSWSLMNFPSVRTAVGIPDLIKITTNSRTFNGMKSTLCTWLLQISPMDHDIMHQAKGARSEKRYIMPPLRGGGSFPADAFAAQERLEQSEGQSQERLEQAPPTSTITKTELLAQMKVLQAALAEMED
jgi:hypothetical protein